MLLKNFLLLAILLGITPACKKRSYQSLNTLERAEVDLEDELNVELEYKGYSNFRKGHYWMISRKITLPTDALQHRADTTFDEEFSHDELSILPKQKGKCNVYVIFVNSDGKLMCVCMYLFDDCTIFGVRF